MKRSISKIRLGKAWSAGLGVGAFYEGAERWQGVVRQDASLGRTEIYGEASISKAFDDTQMFLSARFPVYRNIIAGDEPTGEYSSPVAIQLGISHMWEPSD